jgi:hypothetical protein
MDQHRFLLVIPERGQKLIAQFSLTFVGAWSGLAPDGSALFVRDLSTDEIYSLDLELP